MPQTHAVVIEVHNYYTTIVFVTAVNTIIIVITLGTARDTVSIVTNKITRRTTDWTIMNTIYNILGEKGVYVNVETASILFYSNSRAFMDGILAL